MKTILITGSAGFIGSALTARMLEIGHKIVGIDNLNNYYDINLKKNRLKKFINNQNYTNHIIDIEDQSSLKEIFERNEIDIVINLAAQAGVRYSLINPQKYISTNILGFTNILEESKKHNISHLIYASSSSVYGLNKSIPFSTSDMTNHPASVYAATKKSNELLAHTYSYLYGIPTTGLRFFTVYGPWDRPDMALQQFAKSIINEEPIKLFNYGNHKRDFTYIDDIVEGVIRVASKPARSNSKWSPLNPSAKSSLCPYQIYNIGNNSMVKLERYVDILEKELGRKAKRELLPMQSGDIENTFANVDDLILDFNYKPSTTVEIGVKKFAEWFKDYYM